MLFMLCKAGFHPKDARKISNIFGALKVLKSGVYQEVSFFGPFPSKRSKKVYKWFVEYQSSCSKGVVLCTWYMTWVASLKVVYDPNHHDIHLWPTLQCIRCSLKGWSQTQCCANWGCLRLFIFYVDAEIKITTTLHTGLDTPICVHK